jgi:hypothetical protein
MTPKQTITVDGKTVTIYGGRKIPDWPLSVWPDKKMVAA